MKMRREIIQIIDQNQDLKQFIRLHPVWYKKLARRPDLINDMRKEADDFYGKSFSKRVERLSQGLGFLSMMLELSNMKTEDS